MYRNAGSARMQGAFYHISAGENYQLHCLQATLGICTHLAAHELVMAVLFALHDSNVVTVHEGPEPCL